MIHHNNTEKITAQDSANQGTKFVVALASVEDNARREQENALSITKAAYEYGLSAGYAICEEMDSLGITIEEFKEKGFRTGYMEDEGSEEVILTEAGFDWDGWDVKESLPEIDYSYMYKGICDAFQEFWGIENVVAESRRYDLCIWVNCEENRFDEVYDSL